MDSTNNKTTLEIMGMAWANSLLENSIEWLNTFGENDFLNGGKLSPQTCAVLVVGHAIIQQQERIAIERNERLDGYDCAGAKLPLGNDAQLTVLNREQALAALKERWLNQYPQHTEAEYIAAINEFEKLLGL